MTIFHCIYIVTRGHGVGNPSAIEGQTTNILTSRTGRDAQRVRLRKTSLVHAKIFKKREPNNIILKVYIKYEI